MLKNKSVPFFSLSHSKFSTSAHVYRLPVGWYALHPPPYYRVRCQLHLQTINFMTGMYQLPSHYKIYYITIFLDRLSVYIQLCPLTSRLILFAKSNIKYFCWNYRCMDFFQSARGQLPNRTKPEFLTGSQSVFQVVIKGLAKHVPLIRLYYQKALIIDK